MARDLDPEVCCMQGENRSFQPKQQQKNDDTDEHSRK
jgi:hypothetical protein